jgi:hypothetical protein
MEEKKLSEEEIMDNVRNKRIKIFNLNIVISLYRSGKF